MTTYQITPFIKQNLNLKAHPFLHILIYYKRIFILRYNLFEHLKNINGEYAQKCQNHKNCGELHKQKEKTRFSHLVMLHIWVICFQHMAAWKRRCDMQKVGGNIF